MRPPAKRHQAVRDMNNRRSRIEIIADILRLGRTIKTDITCGCDLNYYQLQRYLRYLTERGFLKLEDPASARLEYCPTLKGRELLDDIERVRALLGLPDRDEAPPVRVPQKGSPATVGD